MLCAFGATRAEPSSEHVPTTPSELRAEFGAQFGIPHDAIPFLLSMSSGSLLRELGEDDLVFGGVVEFVRPYRPRIIPGSTRTRFKWRWWR